MLKLTEYKLKAKRKLKPAVAKSYNNKLQQIFNIILRVAKIGKYLNNCLNLKLSKYYLNANTRVMVAIKKLKAKFG